MMSRKSLRCRYPRAADHANNDHAIGIIITTIIANIPIYKLGLKINTKSDIRKRRKQVFLFLFYCLSVG